MRQAQRHHTGVQLQQFGRKVGRCAVAGAGVRVAAGVAAGAATNVVASSGAADFGLNFIVNQEPNFECSPLHDARFVAACRRDSALARKRRVAWADLAACDCIAVAQSPRNSLLLDQALAGVAVRPAAVALAV